MTNEMYVNEKATINQISFETREKQLEIEKQVKERKIEDMREDSKKSPYNRFYQVNEENSRYLTQMAITNPKALAILLFIIENMDGYNALVISYKVLQERFEISRTTASKCIKYLKEYGFLYVYKAGTCNVYVVNKDLVWKSYGRNTKYCKFPASVMLSASEQDMEKDIKEPLKKEKFTTVIHDNL